MYPWKGLVTRNTNFNIEALALTVQKLFLQFLQLSYQKVVQGQGHRIKKCWNPRNNFFVLMGTRDPRKNIFMSK